MKFMYLSAALTAIMGCHKKDQNGVAASIEEKIEVSEEFEVRFKEISESPTNNIQSKLGTEEFSFSAGNLNCKQEGEYPCLISFFPKHELYKARFENTPYMEERRIMMTPEDSWNFVKKFADNIPEDDSETNFTLGSSHILSDKSQRIGEEVSVAAELYVIKDLPREDVTISCFVKKDSARCKWAFSQSFEAKGE